MTFLKKLLFHSWTKYVIALGICIVILLVNLILNDFHYLINYINGFQAGGAVTFLIGGLSLVTYLGAFDTFGYGFSKLRRNPEKSYRDMYEYSNLKYEERRRKQWTFIPYFVVGLVFIIVGLVLSIFL